MHNVRDVCASLSPDSRFYIHVNFIFLISEPEAGYRGDMYFSPAIGRNWGETSFSPGEKVFTGEKGKKLGRNQKYLNMHVIMYAEQQNTLNMIIYKTVIFSHTLHSRSAMVFNVPNFCEMFSNCVSRSTTYFQENRIFFLEYHKTFLVQCNTLIADYKQ